MTGKRITRWDQPVQQLLTRRDALCDYWHTARVTILSYNFTTSIRTDFANGLPDSRVCLYIYYTYTVYTSHTIRVYVLTARIITAVFPRRRDRMFHRFRVGGSWQCYYRNGSVVLLMRAVLCEHEIRDSIEARRNRSDLKLCCSVFISANGT